MENFSNFEVFIFFVIVILFFLTFIIQNLAGGIILGFLSSTGVSILLLKMKDSTNPLCAKMWNFLLNHKILSDCIASGAFVFLLNPTSVMGLVAGAAAVIFSSGYLIIFDRFLGKNENECSFKSMFSRIRKKEIYESNIINIQEEELCPAF